MRNKRSKKRSKWRFLRNLKKYQTDFKNNGVKMMVTTLAPTQETFYVGVTNPKGGAGAKEKFEIAIVVLVKGPDTWNLAW